MSYRTINDIINGKGNFRTDNVHYAGDNFDFYKKKIMSPPTTYDGNLNQILLDNFQKQIYDETFRYDQAKMPTPRMVETYLPNIEQNIYQRNSKNLSNNVEKKSDELWGNVWTKGNTNIAIIPAETLPPNNIQPISCSKNSDEGTCGLDGGCGNDGLYPILDPKFNMREVAKQLILLEDHCFHTERRCHDCIKKHALMIEGFLEEAITLDKNGDMQKEIKDTLKQFRDVTKPLLLKIDKKNATDNDYYNCAQNLRVVRKPICQNYASFC
jgi:hypothetical protein